MLLLNTSRSFSDMAASCNLAKFRCLDFACSRALSHTCLVLAKKESFVGKALVCFVNHNASLSCITLIGNLTEMRFVKPHVVAEFVFRLELCSHSYAVCLLILLVGRVFSILFRPLCVLDPKEFINR